MRRCKSEKLPKSIASLNNKLRMFHERSVLSLATPSQSIRKLRRVAVTVRL